MPLLEVCTENHTTIGGVLKDILDTNSDFVGKKYPREILNAYLHFEALTDHDYDFSCFYSGFFPSVVTLDGNRKAAFSMKAQLKDMGDEDLKSPEVNMMDFQRHKEDTL